MSKVKSYKYGKKEEVNIVDEQQKPSTHIEDSLLDYAIKQGDWKLADNLLEKEKMRNFELEAINKKINRLQTSINKFNSFEVNNILAQHIVKRKIKEEEDL